MKTFEPISPDALAAVAAGVNLQLLQQAWDDYAKNMRRVTDEGLAKYYAAGGKR